MFPGKCSSLRALAFRGPRPLSCPQLPGLVQAPIFFFFMNYQLKLGYILCIKYYFQIFLFFSPNSYPVTIYNCSAYKNQCIFF